MVEAYEDKGMWYCSKCDAEYGDEESAEECCTEEEEEE